MDELLGVPVPSNSKENRNYLRGAGLQTLMSASRTPGGEGGPTTSTEQPQKHEFPVTSMEWKFEICLMAFMQGGGFGKTPGILTHQWSLLPRHRSLPENELLGKSFARGEHPGRTISTKGSRALTQE